MTAKIDLTIIILNFNTPEWVEKCLLSLEKYVIQMSSFRIQVVVVDNGSQKESRAELTKITSRFSFVEQLNSPDNLGFSGGNNIALMKAKSRYVMLLNSDTEATEQTHLDEMIAYLDSHEDVAVMTPRVELATGGIDWASHRGEPTPWASLTYQS